MKRLDTCLGTMAQTRQLGRVLTGALMAAGLVCGFGCGDDIDRGEGGANTGGTHAGGSSTGGTANPTCQAASSEGAVQAPEFLYNLSGQTGWFAPPLIYDLDGDGSRELIAAYYTAYVYDSQGSLLDSLDDGDSRVYAPHVVGDLDDDGTTEIVLGNGSAVYAYEWADGQASLKAGWPADVTTAGNPPEVRGLAAADLDGNGTIEVIASTTQTADETEGGSQIFVFASDGAPFQPEGIGWTAWPRYNNATGTGNDADRNGMGHHGYGCYGLNVGVGNIDDDPELEILATYDNHHIQAFNLDGVAIDSSPWFTNRDSSYDGQRMTWGQFIRWADPVVEQNHYHDHTGEWPHPSWAEWLQWTASAPSVVDLNGDGRNEVVGVPNVELHEPYETQAYALMVLEGAYGAGDRSAMRLAGWETLPRGAAPMTDDDWYPPSTPPAITAANIQGDELPELIVTLNDGAMYAFSSTAQQLWRFNFQFGKPQMYASEATVADLNQDGSPEIIFSTFGDPYALDSGHLVILAANGALLHDVPLPNPGDNGNGNGAPAAPTVGDLDGDGALEIFVQTFEHGMDVFRVPGSAENCLLWPTARGGSLRQGRPNG